MSIEEGYDAWVKSLMSGARHAPSEAETDAAAQAARQMQASLDALAESQKRQSAARRAVDAV